MGAFYKVLFIALCLSSHAEENRSCKNLLEAINKYSENPVEGFHFKLEGNNEINLQGDYLEEFVKRLFSNTFSALSNEERAKAYQNSFSYQGSVNSPPDLMYRGGDAFEIKKVKSLSPDIALNSSFPKDKLYADDPRLSNACIECEDWDVKDFFYVIGYMPKHELETLWIIHGECYAAEKQHYQLVADMIKEGIERLPSVEIADTNELSRVNNVDPLGITKLRVRGMWAIMHPAKLFGEFFPPSSTDGLTINCIMTKEKYEALGVSSSEIAGNLVVRNMKINSPNDKEEYLNAVAITL